MQPPAWDRVHRKPSRTPSVPSRTVSPFLTARTGANAGRCGRWALPEAPPPVVAGADRG